MISSFGFFVKKIFCKIILICVVNRKKNTYSLLRMDIFEKNSKDFKSKLRLQINYICIRKRFKCLKKILLYYYTYPPHYHFYYWKIREINIVNFLENVILVISVPNISGK